MDYPMQIKLTSNEVQAKFVNHYTMQDAHNIWYPYIHLNLFILDNVDLVVICSLAVIFQKLCLFYLHNIFLWGFIIILKSHEEV